MLLARSLAGVAVRREQRVGRAPILNRQRGALNAYLAVICRAR
jgi:hypothetical protein